MENDYHTNKLLKGRGAQFNPRNQFSQQERVALHIEGLDEPVERARPTNFYFEYPRKIVNRTDSPDIPLDYSSNPYQGCEHGCVYCYARNTHPYWGFSAGTDFESEIMLKPDAPALLEKELSKESWKVGPIMISGNTDCYQPAEKKYKLTRRMLEVLLKFGNPAGVITKNQLILRDLDILKEMAAKNLVHVMISITTLDEDLRRKLEPRTTTAANRLRTMEVLSNAGVPCGVMTAPIIPGLNSHEIPSIIEAASSAGALTAGMTIVRLNGAVAEVFSDWIKTAYPDRAEKVLNQIAECHGGSLGDSRFKLRMTGQGKIAGMIRDLFRNSVQKFLGDKTMPPYDLNHFRIPESKTQLSLF
ncbi:MAG: radical SAM protein [Bacteroidetes bacterium]|nr:MAG: radical SAM protein [Bacteroidota bacterium]REK06677.1 MAG: radical SAM protein [Bacteroidota bacterium]REK33442.1 MAG: radical SAM protein [Bacteroidota bacterium]REK49835.1 MAG: radical SAM protein [Bacteroidota bacterium]